VAGSAQKFGGPWSIIKIETVASYLQRFNTALKNQDFQLVYIDAFAGSGGFQFSARRANPLFDEEEIVETHAGSARRALEVKPQFDRLVFVERDPPELASPQTGPGRSSAQHRRQGRFPASGVDVDRGW
jgi:three-Cys-motif partner protein